MNFEPEAVVDVLLKQGSMLKTLPNTLINSDKSHCIILLNSKPLESEFLVFANTTTQYEWRIDMATRMKLPTSTIVMIRPNIYHHLPRYSAIDCNRVLIVTKAQLVNLYSEDRVVFYQKTPVLTEEHMNQVIIGVKDSPMIEQTVKRVL